MNHTSAACIPAMILDRCRDQAAQTILRRKDRGIWKSSTWAQLLTQVKEFGEALVGFGLGHGQTAAVLSETRPEAVYADLAIQGTGAVSVAIHPEAEADAIGQLLRASGSRLVFVENEEQLDKVLTVRAHCPDLERIVIFDMKGLRAFSDRQCIGLAAFAAAGRFTEEWQASARAVQPDQPAVRLFARDGTELRVLTHREVMQMVAAGRARLPLRLGDERLAVLRMAEVAERIWGLYVALDAGCISNYLESPDTAAENLQELQPTVMGADADAWSHLHDRATRLANAATAAQRMSYRWALRAGRIGGLSAAVANALVLHAVRRELGLNRLRLAYVGGEPVSSATQDWARCLGLVIQRIDEPLVAGAPADLGYDSVMQRAHA